MSANFNNTTNLLFLHPIPNKPLGIARKLFNYAGYQVIETKAFEGNYKKLDKRVMVDMSLTTLHHGHIRLLKQAAGLGHVIVALTSDEEIIKFKDFTPTLSFDQRKEIALSIRYVDEVIISPYLIDEAFLNKNNVDLLVHGDDNVNPVPADRLIIFPRTPGISSSEFKKG